MADKLELDPVKLKDGFKTSEFWVSFFTAIGLLVLEQKGIQLDPTVLTGIISMVILYMASRLGIKWKHEKVIETALKTTR